MFTDQVSALVLPLIEAAGLLLYDVEQKGATLRISIDGPEGVPFELLETLSRDISFTLDEVDPTSGSYMLEVSTPGLERNLRTPLHFEGAVGEVITVKTVPGPDGRKRFGGELSSSNADSITIADEQAGSVEVAIAEIESARTIFEWESTSKTGKSGSSNKTDRRAS